MHQRFFERGGGKNPLDFKYSFIYKLICQVSISIGGGIDLLKTKKQTVAEGLCIVFPFIFLFSAGDLFSGRLTNQKDLENELWWISPDYQSFVPRVIAVVPMINMSLDPQVGESLQVEVYRRIQSKGYQKIDAERVGEVMARLGIQTPEQLSGISYARLGKELNCDAIIQGQVNQSDTQHQGIYDAVVVSCSLQLIDCKSAKPLWRCEQFRTAHRQFQLDPFNALINLVSHEGANRSERIAWLVQEMFRTLPEGPIQVVIGDLLNQAIQIEADISEPLKKLEAKQDEEMIQINLAADILYDFDKYSIRDDAQDTLKNLIPIVNKFPNAEILIIGHTDAIGTDTHNKMWNCP